jgi:hypothetical protein
MRGGEAFPFFCVFHRRLERLEQRGKNDQIWSSFSRISLRFIGLKLFIEFSSFHFDECFDLFRLIRHFVGGNLGQRRVNVEQFYLNEPLNWNGMNEMRQRPGCTVVSSMDF